MIELKPSIPLGDLGNFLNTCRSHGRENKGNVVSLGGSCQNFTGLGPHQTLQTNGCDTKGSIVGFAEKFGLLTGPRIIPEIVGLELHFADIAGVSLQVYLRKTTTIEVVVGKARH